MSEFDEIKFRARILYLEDRLKISVECMRYAHSMLCFFAKGKIKPETLCLVQIKLEKALKEIHENK